MSRVGKQPVVIPREVTITVEKNRLKVVGPKGELKLVLPDKITVLVDGQQLLVSRGNETKKTRANHGTIRSLINNMILGVSEGWNKQLEVIGTGFRVDLNGNKLNLKLGFSHPVIFVAPEGITFEVEENKIKISGANKELVGNLAAKIRKIRKPDAYLGKGIRYLGEEIKLKPGKAAKVGGLE